MKPWILFLSLTYWITWGIVFYAYCVFPLVLALLARQRKHSLSSYSVPDSSASPNLDADGWLQRENWPKVAMIVAAYNEAHVLPAKLANTWLIDYPADCFEIVIGSDGSSDATKEILCACKDERLRVFPFAERRGKISVLSDLVEGVDAEFLIMSDANTMFAPDAVKMLIQPFSDPNIGCVSGELRLEHEGGVSGEGLYWKYEGWIKRNESRLGFLIGCNGGIFALRRQLFTTLPASTIVEDFVLTLRVLEQGQQVLFQPAAHATEPACESARAEMRRKVRIAAGGWQALGLTSKMLHPREGVRAFAFFGHKVLRWVAPLLLLAALVANLMLVCLGAGVLGSMGAHLYESLLAMQIGGLLLAGFTYRSRPDRPLPKWTRPVSYFYLMNYSLLCGFFRFLFKTQRVTWDKGTPIPAAPSGYLRQSATNNHRTSEAD